MENDFYFSKKKRNDAYIWYFLIKFVRMKKIYLDSDRYIVAYIFPHLWRLILIDVRDENRRRSSELWKRFESEIRTTQNPSKVIAM